MLLSNNNIKQLVKDLEKKANEKAQKSLNALCNEVVRSTQLNFNRVVDEVPADDPYVVVSQTPTFYVDKNTIGRKVECVGNQVLFIEFGAGIHESTKTSTIVMDKGVQIEYASRPKINGKVNAIGSYGSHHGLDDYWFYSSQTGRGSTNAEQIRYNTKKGTYTMLTIGIRPVRALYRSLGTSFRKLGSGRLKIK